MPIEKRGKLTTAFVHQLAGVPAIYWGLSTNRLEIGRQLIKPLCAHLGFDVAGAHNNFFLDGFPS
jgi:hypothetical protein